MKKEEIVMTKQWELMEAIIIDQEANRITLLRRQHNQEDEVVVEVIISLQRQVTNRILLLIARQEMDH